MKRASDSAALAELLRAGYKRVLSPLLHSAGALNPLPGGCRFQPTCGEYAAVALARFGFVRGGLLAVGRVLRCHPLARGGFDPVPLPAEGVKAPHLP